MRKRAAGYLRISDDREGRQLGVTRQDEDIRALAERLNADIVAWYTDNDIGASTRSRKKRPDYTRLINDSRTGIGKLDMILSYTSGRLTRRPRESEDIIELAETTGIEIHYVASPSFDLNTSAGRRIARMLAAIDAGESEDIGERGAREHLQAARNGVWRGGPRAFGFEADGVAVRPSEAAEIVKASKAIVAGASLHGLVKDLNARQVPTVKGHKWVAPTLRNVLLRARNAGLSTYKGEVVGKGTWDAIIPESLWRAVVMVLSDPERRNSVDTSSRWLGSGLYRCGRCGGKMRCKLAVARPGHKGGHYYACPTSAHVSRHQGFVDGLVETLVLRRLASPDAAALLRAEAPSIDIGALHTERLAVREQLDELSLLFARRVLDQRQVAVASAELQEQMGRLTDQIAAASRGSALVDIVGAQDVAARWRQLSVDRRRAVVRSLMTVTVLPARRGRVDGWAAGGRYFDPDAIEIRWLHDDEPAT